jgi:hypothetical protein
MDDAESKAEFCARIHAALETLTWHNDVSSKVPADGLYFFYEDGECNRHDGGPRIVRVGNHPRRIGGLRDRLRNHYSGSKNGSVFRKFLGGAIMRRRGDNDSCLQPAPGQGHWEKQDAKTCSRCRSIEEEVSRLLRERFRFRCLEVIDKGERNRLEEGVIAVLASCPKCEPSPDWLGRYAYNLDVGESGLWNSNYTKNGVPLTLEELTRFVHLVERSGGQV